MLSKLKSVHFHYSMSCLIFSRITPTAAAGQAKVVHGPDNYAWLEALNVPVNINMRPGMYTGPTIQVWPNFCILLILFSVTTKTCLRVETVSDGSNICLSARNICHNQ